MCKLKKKNRLCLKERFVENMETVNRNNSLIPDFYILCLYQFIISTLRLYYTYYYRIFYTKSSTTYSSSKVLPLNNFINILRANSAYCIWLFIGF